MAEGLDEVMETSVGLIVDNVSEVINIDDSNIVPPPNIKAGFHNGYVRGIGKVGNEVKLLLDCDKLLNDEEVEAITSNI
jgi:purine-binding chemotaxis protein CheW